MADPPRLLSPALTRRRLLVTLGGLLIGSTLLGWPRTRLSAGLDHDQLRRSMREAHGEHGLAILEEWLNLLDRLDDSDSDTRLRAVNDFFNRRVRWLDDIDIWNQKDYWATPLETLARGEGDCEDYTIGKYATLRQLGVAERRLRLIYVRARLGRSQTTQAHMVLGYYATPGGEPLILDNMQPSIVPAGQRTDLDPLFSFNGNGLWTRGSSQSRADPVDRLSRWRNVIDRMRQQGFTLGR